LVDDGYERLLLVQHIHNPILGVMTDTFSTPAEHAFDHPEIEAVVEAGPSSMGDALANVSVEEAFEVEDTVQRILAGGYKTVCPA
jgi:diphthamide biosynthesis protein 2